MRNDYNSAQPLIMHIDLNSCFATVEQQARVRLRGRPVAVVNRRTDQTMIVTCSYEAKAAGVKLGMKLRDAKKMILGLFHARKLALHAAALRLGWDQVHARLGITKRFYDRFTPAIDVRDFTLRPGSGQDLHGALDLVAVLRP